MPVQVLQPTDLKPGDFYEDCFYHPCLCTEVDTSSGDISIHGLSLVDGTYPRGCGVPGCGVRRLTLAEAIHWRLYGPADATVPKEKRWWYDYPETAAPPVLQSLHESFRKSRKA